MTCNGCVAKAKNELLKLGDVTEAAVQLASPQATITMQKHIPVEVLHSALSKAGNYTITETGSGMQHQPGGEEKASWMATYKPILLIGAYITGITILLEIKEDSINWKTGMTHFMAGFFLVFSFFKLLNLKGFAESYASYDIIAKMWQGWGYFYAFIELGLGLAFLLDFKPFLTNIITFLVMGISIIGVLQSVLNQQKIQCACLGAVFNLPMSTITIIEDALMIGMSGVMVFAMI